MGNNPALSVQVLAFGKTVAETSNGEAETSVVKKAAIEEFQEHKLSLQS